MKHILRTNVCGIHFTYNLGSTEISVYLGSTTKVGQFKNSADSKPSCETRYVDVVITVTVAVGVALIRPADRVKSVEVK